MLFIALLSYSVMCMIYLMWVFIKGWFKDHYPTTYKFACKVFHTEPKIYRHKGHTYA